MDAAGKPTEVIIIDKMVIGDRYVFGFNGIEPFMMEDHCLVDTNSQQRLSFNAYLAREQKHWDNVRDIIPGDAVAGLGNVHHTTKVILPRDTPVYDVITVNHTLTVNGVGCYDDMPEIENHPFVAVIIARILKHANVSNLPLSNVSKFADRLFNDALLFVLIELEDEEMTIRQTFEKELKEFICSTSQNNTMLHIASNLWKTKFIELKDLERLTMYMINNIGLEKMICDSTKT